MKETLEDDIWRLYDASSLSFYEDLTSEKVASIVASMEPDEVSHWFIAAKKDLEWTPLYKCYERFASLPPEKRDSSSQIGDPDFSTRNLFEKGRHEWRRNPRPKMRVKTVITIGGKSYETFTTDLSLSAIKVEFIFKVFTFEPFDVKLVTESGPLELKCQALYDQGTKQWNRMKITPTLDFTSYSDFLSQVA